MPAATITTPSRSGAAPTVQNMAQNTDYTFANNGKVILKLENTGAGTNTVTIRARATIDGDLTVSDRTVSLTTNQVKYVAGLAPSIYNDGDGLVTVRTAATSNEVKMTLIQS